MKDKLCVDQKYSTTNCYGYSIHFCTFNGLTQEPYGRVGLKFTVKSNLKLLLIITDDSDNFQCC